MKIHFILNDDCARSWALEQTNSILNIFLCENLKQNPAEWSHCLLSLSRTDSISFCQDLMMHTLKHSNCNSWFARYQSSWWCLKMFNALGCLLSSENGMMCEWHYILSLVFSSVNIWWMLNPYIQLDIYFNVIIIDVK